MVAVRKDNFLKFHFQSGAGGGRRQKIRNAPFTRERMARRQERGIHAGQRDEFGQKFFRARHAGRMTQAQERLKRIADLRPAGVVADLFHPNPLQERRDGTRAAQKLFNGFVHIP